MVIGVPMSVIKDEQKMCDCCYVTMLSSFEDSLCQHFFQAQVLSCWFCQGPSPTNAASQGCMEDLLITLAVCDAGVAVRPVCINVFVCGGNEPGTEN